MCGYKFPGFLSHILGVLRFEVCTFKVVNPEKHWPSGLVLCCPEYFDYFKENGQNAENTSLRQHAISLTQMVIYLAVGPSLLINLYFTGISSISVPVLPCIIQQRSQFRENLDTDDLPSFLFHNVLNWRDRFLFFQSKSASMLSQFHFP